MKVLARSSVLVLAVGAGAPVMGQAAPCTTLIPPGPVSGVWTPGGSPYCVTGNIAVGVLTILPGVEVFLDPGARISQVDTTRHALGRWLTRPKTASEERATASARTPVLSSARPYPNPIEEQ